jgi:ABC-type dipeptide/oligopeptide/nickel transport system permease subunit
VNETSRLDSGPLLARTPLARPQPRLQAPRWYPNFAGLAGLAILAGLFLLAAFPQLFSPYDPKELVGRPFSKPSAEFTLGTNDIGQDLLSELIWGTRISLTTGLSVAFLAVTIGTTVGLVSGYTSGMLSAALMRLADLTLVLPFLPLIILLSAYLGPGQRNVIALLTLVSWAGTARLVRARVLALMNEPYIEAVRALGGHPMRVVAVHIWPGVRAIALVQLILVASASILAEASLSFLGLGNPSAKSWGAMLYFARASGAFLGESWRWWVLPAGAMITLAVLSLVFLGYALEQKLEPGLSR